MMSFLGDTLLLRMSFLGYTLQRVNSVAFFKHELLRLNTTCKGESEICCILVPETGFVILL
jgi:hypothetical protein